MPAGRLVDNRFHTLLLSETRRQPRKAIVGLEGGRVRQQRRDAALPDLQPTATALVKAEDPEASGFH